MQRYSKLIKKVILLDAKENHKSLANVENILHRLVAFEVDRTYTLIAVGGGMVTDIVGFVSSVYMRGLRCVYVPTTLLNMVDAAIGGKTAVNLDGVKNLIGSFKQPDIVLYDTRFLISLPMKELQNGMAEVIKYGAIVDYDFFSFLEKYSDKELRQEEFLEKIISTSVHIKKDIISKDPEEKNIRKLLNFGHTVGHAIETLYHFSHGQCVAYGMMIASKISEIYFTYDKTPRIERLIRQYGLKTHFQYDLKDVLNVLSIDKKREQKNIHFILLEKIGQAKIEAIPLLKIKKILATIIS